MPDTSPSPDAAPAPPNDLRERIGLSIPWTEPRAMLDLIERAEQAGVTQFWTTQNPTSTDALTAFAAVFPRTRAIRLGTSIVPIYPRHPLALAQQAATAAALGRGACALAWGRVMAPRPKASMALRWTSRWHTCASTSRCCARRCGTAPWTMPGATSRPGSRCPTRRACRSSWPRWARARSGWRAKSPTAPSPGTCRRAICSTYPCPALRDGARAAGRPAPPLVPMSPLC